MLVVDSTGQAANAADGSSSRTCASGTATVPSACRVTAVTFTPCQYASRAQPAAVATMKAAASTIGRRMPGS